MKKFVLSQKHREVYVQKLYEIWARKINVEVTVTNKKIEAK